MLGWAPPPPTTNDEMSPNVVKKRGQIWSEIWFIQDFNGTLSTIHPSPPNQFEKLSLWNEKMKWNDGMKMSKVSESAWESGRFWYFVIMSLCPIMSVGLRHKRYSSVFTRREKDVCDQLGSTG